MLIKKSVIYFLFLFFSNEFLSDSVDKVTYASWNKPDVEILYVLPKEINENTKVLFIIHGNSRDVKKYLNQWIEPSKDKNVILVAPYFDKISYPNFATLQMATHQFAPPLYHLRINRHEVGLLAHQFQVRVLSRRILHTPLQRL